MTITLTITMNTTIVITMTITIIIIMNTTIAITITMTIAAVLPSARSRCSGPGCSSGGAAGCLSDHY